MSARPSADDLRAVEECRLIFALQVERMPGFAAIERRLDGVRTLPVVALKRVK